MLVKINVEIVLLPEFKNEETLLFRRARADFDDLITSLMDFIKLAAFVTNTSSNSSLLSEEERRNLLIP